MEHAIADIATFAEIGAMVHKNTVPREDEGALPVDRTYSNRMRVPQT